MSMAKLKALRQLGRPLSKGNRILEEELAPSEQLFSIQQGNPADHVHNQYH